VLANVPLPCSVDFETRRVDYQMPRRPSGRRCQLEAESRLVSADSGVIRYGKFNIHKSDDGLAESLGSAKAEVEDTLDHECALDSGISVDSRPPTWTT